MLLFKVDGCTNYTAISNLTESAQGNKMQPTGSPATGWYRFQGAAGDQIPEKCDLKWRHGCWLNGTHPSIAEDVVNRRLCFSCLTNRCTCSWPWNKIINVKKCSSFYVYEIHQILLFNLWYCDNASSGKLIWDKLSH